MSTEITGAALVKPAALTVVIGRTKKPAGSLAAASEIYGKYISDNGYGARDAAACTVRDAAGALVASVSYNGRVWAMP